MIIQAISLLEDLDKEINVYAMRVREWYGWHFPEMGKIVQDNIQYAKAVHPSLLESARNGAADSIGSVQRERSVSGSVVGAERRGGGKPEAGRRDIHGN